MQLSVEVHNYMETLVGQVLAQETYVERYSNDQLADLACLALCQLRPIYIRYDVDFLSALPEARLMQLKEQAEVAVWSAESMIMNDRRKIRDLALNELTPLQPLDEDGQLEWYEKPILGQSL